MKQTKMFQWGLLLSATLTLAAACESGTEEEPLGPPVGFEDGDELDGLTGDGPRTPGQRRLTVDELQESVSIVAGTDLSGEPIRFELEVDGETVDAFSDEALGSMLGRPDYVAVTSEDTAPGTLYVKFAGDMARNVCARMVAVDLAREALNEEPSLWRYAAFDSAPTEAQLTANLGYLTLRFLGLRQSAGDPLLESLREVYTASAATFDPQENPTSNPQAEGWRGVCQALFLDPAFHLH